MALKSPIHSKRTLLSSNVFSSFAIVETNIDIRASISSFGLFQFSVEKVYNVRYSTPNSAQASVTCLTALTPFWCPNTLSLPLCFAHLPLPSIITAICLGNFSLIIQSLVSMSENCKQIISCQYAVVCQLTCKVNYYFAADKENAVFLTSCNVKFRKQQPEIYV